MGNHLIESLSRSKWTKSVFTDGEWRGLVRQEQEHDEMVRKYPERVLRYMRLKFRYCEITRELVEDNQRWEEVQKMSVDPDNTVDYFLRKWKAN